MRFILALFLLLAPAAFAEDLAGPSVTVQQGSARLIATKLPDGSGMLGLDLTLTPGWHTYWENPGDSGMPPKITLLSPSDAGPLETRFYFTLPERHETSGIVDFAYQDALLLPFALGEDNHRLNPLVTPVRIKATWLACKDICLPETAELSFDAAAATEVPERLATLLSRLEPASTGLDTSAQFRRVGSDIVVDLPNAKVTPEQLYPLSPANLIALTPAGKAEPLPGGGTRLTYPAGLAETKERLFYFKLGSPGEPGKFVSAEFTANLLPQQAVPEGSPAAPLPHLPYILLLAFLGGLILNVMPCVLPILSLKVLSLIEHPGGRKGAVAQGVGYLMGIVGTLLVLAASLLSLKASGEVFGWGFQLQSPWFLCFLMTFTFLIGLNLSGLLEWRITFFEGESPKEWARNQWLDSVQTGILAVVVATPCTGPFMASAMGATLLLPTGPSLLIFVFLGLGMALPFLLISFIPALRHALPRPGQWMVTLKHALAFPMYATAAWLLWLLGAVAGLNALGIGLVLLLLTVTHLFLLKLDLGRWAKTTLGIVFVLAILLLYPRLPKQGDMSVVESKESFSIEKLEKLRAAGTPVLVNATASWCLTCKVNEKMALSDDKVKAHFARTHVSLLTADWTRSDAEITNYLTSLGRSGVPAYVFYPPHGEPKLLPQILTPDSVIEATKP